MANLMQGNSSDNKLIEGVNSASTKLHLGQYRRRLFAEANTILDERTRNIHNWLKPYDSSMNYNAAIERRQQNTGQWLLKSPMYLE
jgi:hypothetical protein